MAGEKMIGTKRRKTLQMTLMIAIALVAVAALSVVIIGSDGSDAATPTTVTMTIDDVNHTGSVQYLDNGTWTDFGASQTFDSGTVVDIKAISTSDDKFVWWTGDIKAVGEEYELTVGSTSMNITAKFVDGGTTQWTQLMIAVNGNGTIQFDIDGTFVDIPAEGIVYPIDADITLRPNAAADNTFIWWTEDLSGTISDQMLYVDGTKTVGAYFYATAQTYTVQATTSGTGQSNMQYWQNGAYQDFPASMDYTIRVPENEPLQINLNIISGKLINAVESNDPNLGGTPGIVGDYRIMTTTITKDTTVSAVVNTDNTTAVTVNIQNIGGSNGSVKITFDGGSSWATLQAGAGTGSPMLISSTDTVQLEAVENGTSTFVWWTGSVIGADQLISITSDKVYVITAVFAKDTYNVDTTIEKFAGNGDGGKVQYNYEGAWADFPSTGTLKLPAGTSIGVRAVAATMSPASLPSKNVFLWWTGDISGPINTQTLIVDDNKSITAVFNSNNTGDNRNVLVNVVGNGSVEVQNTGIAGWGSDWQLFPIGTPMVVPNDSSTNTMVFKAIPGSITNNEFVWWTGSLRGTDAIQTLDIDGNKTMTATFSTNTQPVTFSVVGSGKIQYMLDGSYENAPIGTIYVPIELGSLSLKAVPDATPNNEFVWWTGDVTGTNASASLGLSGNAKSVSALFSSDLSTVTATTSDGSMEYILNGNTFAFPAGGLRVPNGFSGIELNVNGATPTDWMLNGSSMGAADNPLSISVSSDQAYEAVFSLPTYQITVIVGPNGSADPSGTFDAQEKSDVTFKFTPDSGFVVSDVLLDGVSVMNGVRGNQYILKNVTVEHTVEVSFDVAPEKMCFITAFTDSGAVISPSGVVSVAPGGSTTFTFSALSGKTITGVVIDGKNRNDLVGASSYTFSNVVANHYIYVTTTDKVITLTVENIGGSGAVEYKVGNGSFIAYSGSVPVPAGANITVHVTPDNGYEFKDWLNNGSLAGTDDTLSIQGVNDSVNLGAEFEPVEKSSNSIWLWIAIGVLAVIALLVLAYGLIRYFK